MRLCLVMYQCRGMSQYTFTLQPEIGDGLIRYQQSGCITWGGAPEGGGGGSSEGVLAGGPGGGGGPGSGGGPRRPCAAGDPSSSGCSWPSIWACMSPVIHHLKQDKSCMDIGSRAKVCYLGRLSAAEVRCAFWGSTG